MQQDFHFNLHLLFLQQQLDQIKRTTAPIKRFIIYFYI